ncbi:MAG: rhomboid family intramembrane serine protease [Myxococcales bacterium]|nr:rhomboid family intramembrane serine protease [Myxococcales bacterium]
MIPLADSPRDPEHTAWVTLALMTVNSVLGVAVLALSWIAWTPEMPGYGSLMAALPADYTGAVTGLTWATYTFGFQRLNPELSTSLTSMFLHVGGLHLFGNLLYLWIYGPNVERRLGRVPFLLLYLVAGVASTQLYAYLSPGSAVPVVGASGAISGLLGAYLVFFPWHTIKVLMLFVTTFRLPAWSVIAVFVINENLVPALSGAHTGIAHVAHLGGFAGGMVLAVGVLAGLRLAARRRPAEPDEST